MTRPAERRELTDVIVDTGSEYTLNVRLDLARKELVPAGPVPVAMAAVSE